MTSRGKRAALCAVGLWQAARAATGSNLPCAEQSSARGRELCEAIRSRLEVSVNPHTFKPQAWLPFDRHKELWCRVQTGPADRAAWEEMAKSKSRALAHAADGMLTLARAQAQGSLAEGDRGKGTIFDPTLPGYLLEGGCSQ